MLRDILQSIESGARTTKEIKLMTRAGMGICQGKTCRPLLEKIVAEQINEQMTISPNLTHNFPVRPITLARLAKEKKKR